VRFDESRCNVGLIPTRATYRPKPNPIGNARKGFVVELRKKNETQREKDTPRYVVKVAW